MTNTGTLFVVATPIGNLEDITMRALRTLKEVGLILCEDTRHSRKLMSHFGISTPLESLHEHNEKKRIDYVIAKLRQGMDIALVSDAGTPIVSDPGAELVAACIRQGIRVSPIPGPSAPVAALSASGMKGSDGFIFLGFLPDKLRARKDKIRQIASISLPVILFVPPHDAAKTIRELAEQMPTRKATLAREMTKLHEQFVQDSLSNLAQMLAEEKPKGEITLVLDSYEIITEEPTEEDIKDSLKELMEQNPRMGTKELAGILADRFDMPKRKAYKLVLETSKR